MAHRIHQIFYSPATRDSLDSGFIALDYLSNDRPDWREYWPVRKYLQTTALDVDGLYGFFSPKFRQKTNLASAEVHRFIDEADADVVLFSPFFDQSAFFLNVFEQAALQHPGIAESLALATDLLMPGVPATQLVMHSLSTVFCNFFAAKPRFWQAWLASCERLFAVAEEQRDSLLGKALNAPAEHLGGAAPLKVFVIERVASLLLATRNDFRVRAYNPIGMPIAAAALHGREAELCTLDALKIAYTRQPHPQYLTQFAALRQELVARLQRP